MSFDLAKTALKATSDWLEEKIVAFGAGEGQFTKQY